ncbi:hypothetical protein ACLMJK_006997 [Lecanora helva]
MDTADLIATWISAIVTTIGLASLITQIGTIKAQLDPFHRLRGEDHLGHWGSRRPSKWQSLIPPPPLGPVLEADIDTCLGLDVVYLSRRPTHPIGDASWTALLSVFHSHSPHQVYDEDNPPLRRRTTTLAKAQTWITKPSAIPRSATLGSATLEKGNSFARPASASGNLNSVFIPSWPQKLKMVPLNIHRNVACITISSATLIAFILLSQGREISRFNGPSGLRLLYATYSGFYQIEWPLGGRPTITFSAYDGFQGGHDTFPTFFARRPRKCIEMATGVIDRGLSVAGKPSKLAFAGRKKPRNDLLKLLPRRFAAQRSASGLYNKFGGLAYQVDFLFRERMVTGTTPDVPYVRKLEVPSLDENRSSIIYVPHAEGAAIADCLDHLPWSPLAWSIHRGLRDILIAWAMPYLMAYREALAGTLAAAVLKHKFTLRQNGWDGDFVTDCMAEQATSAILGDERCSGDTVRVVTAITDLLWEKSPSDMDYTLFWKSSQDLPDRTRESSEVLPPDTAVALVKTYLVWWSHDFDYELDGVLPQKLYII